MDVVISQRAWHLALTVRECDHHSEVSITPLLLRCHDIVMADSSIKRRESGLLIDVSMHSRYLRTLPVAPGSSQPLPG